MTTQTSIRASGFTAFFVALLATVLGLPVAHATSFPQYPLQTGASYVPPNILFILDDSGSMGRVRMPVDSDGELAESIADRSSSHNTVYYNPKITYRTWMKPDGERMTGGTSYDRVYSDYDRVGGSTLNLLGGNRSGNCNRHMQNSSNRDVCGADAQTYYVAKGSQLNSGNNSLYYRFQLRMVDGTPRVVRSSWATSGTISSSMGCPDPGKNSAGWRECTYVNSLPVDARPGGRSEEDEITNYATWYSYHRSRMKMAKAGAAEAFAPLGNNIRVGYRSIHNRSGFNIPVRDGNSGLFEDAVGTVNTTSKSTWFDRLFNATAGGQTPLRIALDDAGKYFMLDSNIGPYGPESGSNQFACRQNFSILTTDGYWNDSFSGIGNQDGGPGLPIHNPLDDTTAVRYEGATAPFSDGHSNTLADVAMKYWKSDLRDLDNIVPTTSGNPAFWQHMVTFGISIGLGGSLDQKTVEEIVRDGSPRRNGVNVAWPNPADSNPARIDDLLHASVNGRGSFIAAMNAEDFGTALQNMLGAIQARLASGSNVATNSTSFQADSRMFQATYMSGHWTGDVVARDVTAAGGIAAGEIWRVSSRIDANNSDTNTGNDYHNRLVRTWTTQGNGSGAMFPTAAQLGLLARTGTAAVTGADNANYLKGDQSRERSRGGTLRNRSGLLGDIVNSSPFYVKDTETLYVGANDGMLHAINALSGDVLFSYVPAGIDFAKLATLSDPDYTHNFFMDGPVAVSSRRVVAGKNYLVAGLGRGGKGVFALDVSDPRDFRNQSVLWDRTGDSDTDMGHVLGDPIIVRGNNNRTLAIVSNGIGSVSGNAVLYIYDVASGDLLKKINVAGASDNGLSAPRAADMDGNGTVDYVYAGDLKGRLWKFDLSAASAADWGVAFGGAPLFTATDDAGVPQPITGGLALALEPISNRIWVTFGTGRLISLSDLSSTSTQSIYGVIDDGSVIAGRSQLTRRTIAAVGKDAQGRSVRAFEAHSPIPASSRGWLINLGNPLPGERVVSGPRINGRAVWVSSVVPDVGDGCEAGGTGYLNALDVFTGTSPSDGDGGSSSFFDFDGDGSGDNENLPGDGAGQGHGLPIGSVDFGIGMPTESEQIDELVVVCGSDGVCEEAVLPPGSGTPRRLGWRELFNRE